MKQAAFKISLAVILGSSAFIAVAEPTQGSREVTLSGAGGSDKSFDNTLFNIEGTYGKYLSSETLLGVRQSIGVAKTEGDDSRWNGATRFFADYHFGDRYRPYVGASLGYIYGDGVEETFIAGPEVGLKAYVLENTFIAANIEYQFLFDHADDADSQFDDGAFAYSVGMGFNF